MHYTWDVEGNRTSVSVPGTMYLVTTEYDANHRPVRMVDEWTGDVWFFNYDAANRRTSVVYPDGSATFTSYDAAGQVIEQRAVAATGATLFLEQNTYDQRSNITETLTQDERRSYSYNRRDWLTLTVVEDLTVGTFYFQKLDYNAAGSLIRQELRAPSQNKLPFTEIFYNSQEGTPELTENIVITYQYNPADQLVYERGTRDDGSYYEAQYAWDGAGNMAGKTVRDFKGNQVINTMTWSAENRLLAQANDNGLAFYNPSLVEKDGKEQNTWATDRTWLNSKYVSRVYDHQLRHVLWEGDAANPEARYILGPNRDEILASAVKMGGGVVRSFTYQNFRQDVLSVQSANALYSSTRKYLPTGLTITDSQSPGNPGRGRGRPNPNPNTPPPPLPFGWQGKEALAADASDFSNRLVSIVGFLSSDPLGENKQGEQSIFVLNNNNSLVNTDPSGLYYISTSCVSAYKASLSVALNRVYWAVNSPCVGRNNATFANCMPRKQKVVTIYCQDKLTNPRTGEAVCAYSVPYSSSFKIAPYKHTDNRVPTRPCDTQDSTYTNLAMTILHEYSHLCGCWYECCPNSCVYSCRTSLGGYYPSWSNKPCKTTVSYCGKE